MAASLKYGRPVFFSSLLSAFYRVACCVMVAIFIVFAIAMLSSCGRGKPTAELQQERADYMRKQAAETNRGIENLRRSQQNARPVQPSVQAPAPVLVKRGETEAALR